MANSFEDMISGALQSEGIDVLQVNLGLRCNQSCAHCHLGCSPSSEAVMPWPTMQLILDALENLECRLVDLTGGAPELNPDFRRFVTALREAGQTVQVRTNLSVLSEPEQQDQPELFGEHRIRLVGSMPCYLEENVRSQRGAGVYEKSVAAIRKLNELGYGRDPELQLDLVYNPGGPFLPPEQAALEADYRRELAEQHGITFSKLLTITNMPIGRYLDLLEREGQAAEYRKLLRAAFNPQTVDGLMCRHQVSVGWDGRLYDCDFNLALGLPIDHGAPDTVDAVASPAVSARRIVTGEHCFGCTAGSGSSCGGALVGGESCEH